MSRKKTTGRKPKAQQEVYVLTELEQVKVLADPLRLRILETLCEAARTTKQVSGVLGEKPTKLYHHIDALERVGLIRLETTRQKRGTLEKYYRAIATSFRADPELFTSAPEPAEGWLTIGASVLEKAVTDLRRIGPVHDLGAELEKAIFASLRVRASRAELEELRQQLEDWVERARKRDSDEDEEAEYRFVVVAYPVPGDSGS